MSNNIHIVIFLLFKSLNTFIHCASQYSVDWRWQSVLVTVWQCVQHSILFLLLL